MTNRRSFCGMLLGWLGTLCGVKASISTLEATEIDGLQHCFRWIGPESMLIGMWKPIKFKDIKQGDRILMIDGGINIFIAKSDPLSGSTPTTDYVVVERSVVSIEGNGDGLIERWMTKEELMTKQCVIVHTCTQDAE